MKNFIDIIKNLEEQIKEARGGSSDVASWTYEQGILLSVNNARQIVEGLKRLSAPKGERQ